MGNDVTEVMGSHQVSSGNIKVHNLMCGELIKGIDRVAKVFPDIESSRPGSNTGIQALCSLTTTMDKAKMMLQYCAESSRLYLLITGEAMILRCQRIRNALTLSLSEIQSMVPQVLTTQISEIIKNLRDIKFTIEPLEAEAARLILLFIQQNANSSESTLESDKFKVVASRLHIASSKDVLIEKRALKNLLEKVSPSDQRKRSVVNSLLQLLLKYEKLVVQNHVDVDTSTKLAQGLCSVNNSGILLEKVDDPEVSSTNIPPEKFRCPISLEILYDPVVISSGQTYERIWIEKWFSEGHDTCPKTQQKLSNLSVMPNTCLKELISEWCIKHNVVLSDPNSRHIPAAFPPWVNPSLCSISSVGSSLNFLPAFLLYKKSTDSTILSEVSQTSLGSSDSSFGSDALPIKNVGGVEVSTQTLSWSAHSQDGQSLAEFSHEMYEGYLKELASLSLKSQTKAVEDIKSFLSNDQAAASMLYNGFLDALKNFLTEALAKSNTLAQRTGCQILLALVNATRNEIPSICEDAFHLLVPFLDSDISREALEVMRQLCGDWCSKSEATDSKILQSILLCLDSQDPDSLSCVVKILYDLSCHCGIRSSLFTLGCIPRLIPLLCDGRLSENCIKILQNLCQMEEGLVQIAETEGCITSIAELLEMGNLEEQEHATSILFSLCSHSSQYSISILKEGIIPSLVSVSVNGNTKGKETAIKLLQILRDITHSESLERQPSPVEETEHEISFIPSELNEKKSISEKFPIFLRRKYFLKQRLQIPSNLLLF